MDFARIIFRDLTRNLRRTIMTITSIAVSLFVFCALMSFAKVPDQLRANANNSVRLVCRNKAGLGHGLPQAYTPKIRALPHIVAISAWNFFGSRYRRPDDTFPTIDVDVQDIEVIWPEWQIQPAALAAFRTIRRAALVAPKLMRRYGWHVGDEVALFGIQDLIPVTTQIVGVLGPKVPEDYFIFRRDYLVEMYRHFPHRVQPEYDVDFYWIKADSVSSIPSIIAEVDETFANSSYETMTDSEVGFITSFMSSLNMLFTVAKILCLIVLITMTLVAANTAAMSVRERRREVAIMRAIGFERQRIAGMLIGESLAIAVVGGMLGCLAAYVTLWTADIGREIMGPFGAIRMPLIVALYGIAGSAMIGFASGAIPAFQMVRRNIVDLLRAVN
jgi:putative ABC transport system permease protein